METPAEKTKREFDEFLAGVTSLNGIVKAWYGWLGSRDLMIVFDDAVIDKASAKQTVEKFCAEKRGNDITKFNFVICAYSTKNCPRWLGRSKAC